MTLTIKFRMELVDEYGAIRTDINTQSGYLARAYYDLNGNRNDIPVSFTNGVYSYNFGIGYRSYYDKPHVLRWLYFIFSSSKGMIYSNPAGPFYGTEANTSTSVTLKAVVPRGITAGTRQPETNEDNVPEPSQIPVVSLTPDIPYYKQEGYPQSEPEKVYISSVTGMTNYTPTQDAHVANVQNYVNSTLSNIPYEQTLVVNQPTGAQTLPPPPAHTVSPGSAISPAEQAARPLPTNGQILGGISAGTAIGAAILGYILLRRKR